MNDKLENLLREFEVTTCDNEAFWNELLNLFSVSNNEVAVCPDCGWHYTKTPKGTICSNPLCGR